MVYTRAGSTGARLEHALTVDDVRRLARRRLPRAVFAVIESGIGDDRTARANVAAFGDIEFRPRALADVSTIDTSIELLGQRFTAPFLLAPAAYGRVCHPEAERAVARAADARGIGYFVPGGASESAEDIAASAHHPLWYQYYLSPDRDVTEGVLERIRAVGYRALCISIDTPGRPFREADFRNGLILPIKVTPKLIRVGLSRPRWARDFVIGSPKSGFDLRSSRQAYRRFSTIMDHLKPVTADDLAWIRERWSGPLVVKGVLRREEVDAIVDVGADAVVVSNHGGRNLDTAQTTIAALPEVVDAVAGRIPVLVDGGIRHGGDIVKALALGATACLVGRAYFYGLAAGGQAGVERIIDILLGELQHVMAFVGAPSLPAIDRSLVKVAGQVSAG